MARKVTRRAAAKPSAALLTAAPALVVNPFGETQQRKISKSKIADSVFTLDDGTKLIARPIVSDIRRAVNQYNQAGEPLYFLTLGFQIVTKAPKRLRQPKPKKPA
jgi:hypothetical protein